MKKIICMNCGSSNIDFMPKYYQCTHCQTKYQLPKEIQREKVIVDESKASFNNKYIAILIGVISILLSFFYFIGTKNDSQNTLMPQKEYSNYEPVSKTPIMINNSHAKIGTQSIVINNYSVEKNEVLNVREASNGMDYWNLVFKNGQKEITALTATPFNSYIMIANGQFIELDRKGNIIWSREFIPHYSATRRRAIIFNKNYIFSYGSDRHGGETVIFDSQKKIKIKLPIYFHSLVITDKGFIGVTRDELKHFNIQGEELWSKSLNRVASRYSVFNEVVKLKNNTFLELGIDKENILWISNYKKDGSLLWQHKTSTYETYIKNVVATEDGGFIISAGRYIKVSKYNSQGKLEWTSNKSKYKKPNAFFILESNDGYIHLNRLPNGFVVSKLDYDGNVLWEEKYQGKKRILLNGITKAHDGGYLLGVRNELGYGWLVKMSEQGEIRSDFNDDSYQRNPNTKLLYTNKTSRKDRVVSIFRKTGGNCNRVALSSDEKYLYATALAGGFYIFDVSNSNNPKELSQFSKSKTKFHFYSNGAYGPVSRSIPALEGDYNYNHPQDFLISSDDKRAYIIDIIHGFYILDIEDKQHPKLLASFKNLKGTSLAFNHEEKEVLLPTIDIAKGELTLVSIDVDNPKIQHRFKSLQVKKHLFDGFPLYHKYISYPLRIISIDGSNRVLLSYDKQLLLFDMKKEALISKVKVSNRILNITLSPNKQECYASLHNKTLIYSLNNLKFKNRVSMAGRFLKFSKNGQLIYTESEKTHGLLVSNISDINNPKTVQIYKAPPWGVYNFTLSKDEQTLYMAFGAKGLGISDVK